MASQQTPNYRLSRWKGTDRILMEEFNSDNEKIDTALKANADAAAAAAAALENCGNCDIGLFTYTGDGKYGSANPTTITFPKMPTAFFLRGPRALLTARGGDTRACLIIYTGSSTTVDNVSVTWEGNQFKFYSSKASFQLNGEGDTHWGLAFYQKK